MKRELVFNIETQSDEIVITIDVVQGGRWDTRRKLYPETLIDLDKELRALILELAEEKRKELHARGLIASKDTMDMQKITLNPKRAINILKKLCECKKLYFKRQKLMFDELVDVNLAYKITKNDEGSFALRGFVVQGSKTYPLADADLICKASPSFIIIDQRIQLFQKELAWKWIKKALEENTLSFNAYESLLEDIEDDDASPKIMTEELVVSDPFPLLVLKDAYGAFSKLMMDYDGRIVDLNDPWESWRNRDVEKVWKKDLAEAGYSERQDGEFYCPVEKVSETLSFLIELGWRVQDRSRDRIVLSSSMNFSLLSGENDVLVRGDISFGERKASVKDVLDGIRKNEPFLNLGGGHRGLIPKKKLMMDFPGLFDGELCAAGVKLKKYQLESLRSFWDKKEISFDGKLQKLHDALTRSFKKEPGEEFKGELRPYQLEGLGWLSFLHENGWHGILADDMGLGKTVQVIAFLTTIKKQRPVLVVCPASLLFNWKRELEAFLPSAPVCVYHGDRREFVEKEIIITSYSILRQEIEFLKNTQFSCAILDEAQAIKNPRSQTASAAFRLRADFRLSVTGTPVENNLSDLASQFQFLFPELLDKSDDPARIMNKCRPFVLRRKKTDVAKDLPEKIEQTEWLQMGDDQARVYHELLSGYRQGLLKKVGEDGLSKHRMEVFEAILRLRQVCCDPALAGQITKSQDCPSVKKEALFLDLETILEEGQKVLVFSQFTSMLSIIGKECQERGWVFAKLDGATKDRAEPVRQFQEDEDIKIMLVSLKAGGLGLNLTRADYVILYDPWWNVAVENQAIDRAHRIGRGAPVVAKRYIIKDSIEEKMMALKESKRMLSDSLFGAPERLGFDELEFLFG